MSKKGQTQSCSRGGAFNQSWNIGHHKRSVFPSGHHSQIWDEGGEWIICDLRSCRRYFGEKGRFSCVGKTDEAYVREEFQLKTKPTFLSLVGFFGMPGSSPGGCSKPCIPPAAPTPFCTYESLAVEEEILQYLSCLIISDKRADWNPNEEVFPIPSGLIFSFTVGPLWGTKWFWVS
jgi:hypothetical protein